MFKFRPPIEQIFRGRCVCYVAPKGTGKSTLQAVLANEYHNNNFYRLYCATEINRLNDIGFKKLSVPRTLVYSDTGILLRDNQNKFIYSNYVNPYELQVPNEVEKSFLAPPGALISIDEPYKYWSNRESASFPERVEAWFWLTRHFDININMFYQTKDAVDIKIRENLDEYNIVKDMQIKYYFWRKNNSGYRQIKKVTWILWKYHYYEDFISDKIPPTKETIKKYKKMLRSYFLWLPPFCWFRKNRELKFNLQVELDKLLELQNVCEVVEIKFKGNPFELFNSKNFAPVQFRYISDKAGQTDKDYQVWAENLQFSEKESPALKPITLEEFKAFNQQINVIRPETFTRINKARELLRRKTQTNKQTKKEQKQEK